MDSVGFKAWLKEQNIYAKAKLYSDCVSRAARVEAAFQAVDPEFSFLSEFSRDKGVCFINMISRRGVEIPSAVALPIGTNQMDSIASATKKYFQYLGSKQ